VSLLLDALKEAEKSRKDLEASATPATEAASDPAPQVESKELVLDLDLEPPSDSLQNNQPKPIPQEAQTSQKKKLPEKNLELEAGTPLDSGNKAVTPVATSDASSTAQQAPKPISAPIPTKIVRQAIPEKNTRVATDVFQNQQNASSKLKSRLPLLILIFLLVLIGLLGMYFLLSLEKDSAFPQPTRTMDDIAQINELAPPVPLVEQNTLPDIALGTLKENKTITELATAAANAPENETPLNKPTKNTEKIAATMANGERLSTNKAYSAEPKYTADPVQQDRNTLASNTSQQALPKSTQAKSGIQISKRKLSARSISSLSAAKKALEVGNLADAESAYRQALTKSPGNVTAMSALANVLVQQGNTQEAQALFVETLQKDPENLTAKTGLINLSAADPSNLSAGSELKQLLTEHPQEAYLHASLGNFHARRNEWPSAQASYFEAFALDPENPDYAFNLAIGLDQIGKSDIAINYYEKAIELLDKRPARFIKTDVERRLNELKGLSKIKGTAP
jgi:tetratricopeptide (TPR) repeat protein